MEKTQRKKHKGKKHKRKNNKKIIKKIECN